MKKLILIDSHAIIHRAYHALPPLTSPLGEPTNAVYGFSSILLRILRELKPDYLAAAFDMPGPTFRHIAYERYKATRPETPSDLSSQFTKVKEVLSAFGIKVYEKESYEADDIIGTLVKKFARAKNVEIIIVTGDMDALQLVGPRTRVYSMKKGISETVIYDEKEVYNRYGLKPEQLIDFKGLRGDPSDNISGVKGIGEKTAIDLIKKFGSIDRLYKSLKSGSKKISPSVSLKLKEGEENAKFSRELATIKIDVPIEIKLEDIKWVDGENQEDIKKIFIKFGFFSLLKRLDNNQIIKEDIKKETAKKIQTTLLETANKESVKIQAISKEGDFGNFVSKIREKAVGIFLNQGNIILIRSSDNQAFSIDKEFLKNKSAKAFFEDKNNFYVYDLKSLIHFFRKYNLNFKKAEFDIMLAAYLVESFRRDFSYPAIASRELGRMVSPDAEEEISIFFDTVSKLEIKLKEGKIRRVFEEIELPLSLVLADMEEKGVLIDIKFLKGLATKVDKELVNLTDAIYKLSGEEFNINSTQQLSKILFDKLEIKTYGLRRTEKGGVISTSATELEKLKGAHPVIDKILSYRELMKLKTTYIDVLPDLVDSETKRLHTTFNQTGTSTGRLSSTNPNLQNIPISSEIGREIRKAFIVKIGFDLTSFDYSQIELRVAAHLADDKKMIEAFHKGYDIHALTASEVYNIPLHKVTSENRRNAKTLNFGILYGMGPVALSESTGMSKDEARNFIGEYFHDFAGVKDFIEKIKKAAEENGYVETLFGRRRYIPEIFSPNWQIKREAERMAVSTAIQGSATGDIAKMAMIKVADWIKKEGLDDSVRMLLQVHDELLFEIKKDLVKKITPRIKEIMENVAKLKVPLVVDVKTGNNWGELK